MKKNLSSISMKNWRLTACGLGLAAAIPAVLWAAGEDPVKKPEQDRPTSLKELENDPNYKRAPLMTQPGAPLSKTPTPVGGTPTPLTNWQWHKNAMHLKAVKRSGQDNRPLSSTLNELMSGNPGAPEEPESGFERVKMESGHELTIFRFTNLGSFIKGAPGTPERQQALQAAIALGKAFFWDTRFSSDKKVSCATCHYAAGTDQRTDGVVSLPANFGIRAPWPRMEGASDYEPFRLTSADLVAGSSELEGIQARGLFDPASVAGYQIREVIGSLGVPHKRFGGNDESEEKSESLAKPYSNPKSDIQRILNRIHSIEEEHRQVTPRNAGTVINAIFNRRNFHDSRASPVFNGHTGWGEHTDADINRALFVLRREGGIYQEVYTWSPKKAGEDAANPYYLANASLASQAVEPIMSDVEMSYRGRLFHHIARRMLDQPILNDASIDPQDSSLGQFSQARPTYQDLITRAFVANWQGAAKDIKLIKLAATQKDDPNTPEVEDEAKSRDVSKLKDADFENYSLTEANFGLFWGLALHLYQSTLISHKSPFDIEQENVRDSRRTVALSGVPADGADLRERQPMSPAARRGFAIFRSVGCVECHAGAEFTSASFMEPGLLLARVEDKQDKPAPGLFDPVKDEEPEDEEIVLDEEELCDEKKLADVECMQMAGRFESLYDGGNYNIGISRYFRDPNLAAAPRWPNDPGVIQGTTLTGPLGNRVFPENITAIWEDSGNGNAFIPQESGIAPENKDVTLSKIVRSQFGTYLGNNVDVRHRLLQKLGLPVMDAKEIQMPKVNSLNVTRAALGDTAAENTLNKEAGNAQEAATLKTVAAEMLRQQAIPLNYTQQSFRILEKSDQKVLEAPALPITPEQAQKFQERGLLYSIRKNKRVPVVTPATPPPPHSITRRWKLGDPDYEVRYKERISDAGSFKAPSLRNIELTGPYMHNGSLLTLEAVVDFYARGGDYNHPIRADEDQFKTGDIHPEMEGFQISTEQRADLVAFLKSLTDERVRLQQVPFDHPSLKLPPSPHLDAASVDISAVGAGGRPDVPIQSFERVLETQ